MKFVTFYLIFLLLASCALSGEGQPSRAGGGPEIFRVGDVEVRLYQNRERMARDLPPFFTLLEATRVGNQQIRVNGYYDAQNKRIYSIDDARVVIHEFKHYLEPGWRHGSDNPRGERKDLHASREQDDGTAQSPDLASSVLLNN